MKDREQTANFPTCAYCAFARPAHVDNRVECHRFPPSRDLQGRDPIARFLLVDKTEWCGEYR